MLSRFLVAATAAAAIAVSGAAAQTHVPEPAELGPNGEYGPLELSAVTEAALQTFDAAAALGSYRTRASHIVRDDGDCGSCVGHVSEHIIREVLGHIKHFCENAECPVIRARCERLAEHEEALVGFLVARIRPAQSAFGYCFGKGACEHPGVADGASANATATDAFASTNPVRALGELLRLADSSDEFGELLDAGVAAGLPAAAADLVDQEAADHDGDHGDERCPRCVGFVAHHVMGGVVMNIIEFCERTECPVLKEHCRWVMEHHEFVFGTLLERVEPAKFAVGACIANGRCAHGGHHPQPHEGDGDADADSDGPPAPHGHHGHRGHHGHHHGHHRRHHGHHHGHRDE